MKLVLVLSWLLLPIPQVSSLTPEDKLLAQDAGTWDVVFEPLAVKAVEVRTMGCGGYCLISDLTGEAMGRALQGHGMVVWDRGRKKFIGVFGDSMTPGVVILESTYNAATKRLEGTAEGPDEKGGLNKSRFVTEMPSPQKRVTTVYASLDGKDMEVMKITYTKRN